MISGHSSLRSTILIVLLIAANLTAQENRPAPAALTPGSQTTPAPRPVLVTLPVFVTDAAGLPVSGLQKNDFVIVENAKPQVLNNVEEFSPVQAGTNKPGPGTKGASSPLVVIAFDLINTRVVDRGYAREQFLTFLLDVVAPGPRVTLVSVSPDSIQVLHSDKNDSRLLTAAIRRVLGRGDAGPAPSEQDAATIQADATELSNWTLRAAEADAPASTGERQTAVLQTLRAWQQLGHALAGIPGRKSVIWATTGLPFSIDAARMKDAQAGIDADISATRPPLACRDEDIVAEYKNTWRVLQDANAALYPLYTGDMLAKPASPESVPAAAPSSGATAPPKELTATLDALAGMTGGRAFYRAGDPAQVFGQASRDASAYYLLTYPLTDLKPGWRQVDTMVTRPNVFPRAPAGYFVTRATLDVNASRACDLQLALSSPVEFTGLPLRISWGLGKPGQTSKAPGPPSPGATGSAAAKAPPQQAKTGLAGDSAPEPTPAGTTARGNQRVLVFRYSLPANSISIDEANDRHLLLDLAATVLRPGGEVVRTFERQVDRHVTSDMLQTVRSRSVSFEYMLEIPPGEYVVRFVMRDGISGKIGSVILPLKAE